MHWSHVGKVDLLYDSTLSGHVLICIILIMHCDGQVYKFHTIFNKRFKIYEHVNNHNF